MTATRQEGFTLLELLISVSLLVLLMAMLFAGLDLGTRHIGRQSARLDRASRMVVAQSFLRLQLADARAVTASTLPGDAITFDGRLDGVDFVSAAPQAVAQGGLQVLSVGIVDPRDAGGEQLLVGWRPLTAPGADASVDAPAESEHRAALLDHIQAAAFAYFGAAQAEDTPSWHPTWQNMNYLPSLIRLSITFTDGQRMPELVVAVRAASGATGATANPAPPQ
ncbi:MAG TPA: prepilin-type N-terminal cleavage/methylation domain-containing protein [Stellaceae bacterium]